MSKRGQLGKQNRQLIQQLNMSKISFLNSCVSS
jgi:hypothetical protein